MAVDVRRDVVSAALMPRRVTVGGGGSTVLKNTMYTFVISLNCFLTKMVQGVILISALIKHVLKAVSRKFDILWKN